MATNHQSISQLIDQIIARRHAILPIIRQHRQELCAQLDALDPSDDTTRTKIGTALAACDSAEKRFSRDSITISIVGKARSGKSRLVQSISNLPAAVIPDYPVMDCTGAVSTIENRPGMFDNAPEGMKQEAHLTFKTEDQMIKTVQTYLDKLIPAEKGRIIIRRLSEISDKTLIDRVTAKMVSGRAENALLHYLKAYVEHYDEWAPLVVKKSDVIRKDTEIATYVAQSNGKGEYCYKYLAVDTCRIYCTFDYRDAGKITLIDTVGLGNNSLGIAEDMLEVINDKSDAVVFLHLPYSPAGGYVDSEITNAYRLIKDSCRDRDLSKWLFWLINDSTALSNSRARCEACVKTLKILNWPLAMTAIADVSDQEQVREAFLIPMLKILAANLDTIDSLYTKELDDIHPGNTVSNS